MKKNTSNWSLVWLIPLAILYSPFLLIIQMILYTQAFMHTSGDCTRWRDNGIPIPTCIASLFFNMWMRVKGHKLAWKRANEASKNSQWSNESKEFKTKRKQEIVKYRTQAAINEFNKWRAKGHTRRKSFNESTCHLY